MNDIKDLLINIDRNMEEISLDFKKLCRALLKAQIDSLVDGKEKPKDEHIHVHFKDYNETD